MQIKSNEPVVNTTNNNDHEALINSETICCSAHRQTLPYIMFPGRQTTLSPQLSQPISTGSRSRYSSNSNLVKTSPILSRQSTVCYIHK
jgi:hypothetical protein